MPDCTTADTAALTLECTAIIADRLELAERATLIAELNAALALFCSNTAASSDALCDVPA